MSLSRMRHALTAALVASALVTLTGCGSDDDGPRTSAAEATSSAETADAATGESAGASDDAAADAVEEDDDASTLEFLKAAGIGDGLVNDLGEVGDANGYGMDADTATTLDQRRLFATTQIGTCRNVASGHRSWDGVQNSDVGGGASEEQAAAMADFLRGDFCPHVKPLKEAPLPKQTLDGPEEDAKGGRGLGSTVAWWDARYQRVTWSEACARQTGQPMGEPLAYRIAKGVVVCADIPPAKSLKKHLISVDVVFAAPVPADRADEVVLSLLPADATTIGRSDGVNPDWSPLEGACLSNDFNSATMEKVTTGLEKDPEPAAHAVYYSDGATDDGAVGPYTGKVKQAVLATGTDEPGFDGDHSC
ncbi:hypothetical protein ACFY93_07220 [Streptomyces sp. NPDC008313]|uniref:hypothetical protein n=1 Tax=Streptomyces sp. NPDC008313 TaxID=3364826 RepID=UPI0036F071A3